MATNFKKELKGLISRFDAAQEAFSANSTDVKKLSKQHKKAVKALKKELSAAQVEIEALKAELAIAKLGAPVKEVKSSKPATRRPAGTKGKAATVKKTTTSKKSATKKAAPAAKAAATSEAAPVTKAEAVPAKTKARRGRPAGTKAATAKKASPAKKAATGAKRGPGRPRTKPKVEPSALQAIQGVGPAMAKQFEAAGVKTPAAMASLSNEKMAAILENCGPRYRNATPEKMDAYRAAATAAK